MSQMMIIGDCVANVVASIQDAGGRYLYAELLGQEGSVKKIGRYLAKGKTSSGEDHLMNADHKRIVPSVGAFVYEPLDKGVGYCVYSSQEVSQDPIRVVYGETMEDVMVSWHKWMRDVQVLPMPTGNKIEEEIFKLLVEKELIRELETTGDIIAFFVPIALAEGNEEMRNVVLDVLVAEGVLGIDRLRKQLKNKAPSLGESDPEHAEVFVQFKDKDTTYSVIEYDDSTDMVFAYVQSDKGDGFEEHNLSRLFQQEKIGILEVKGLYVDDKGLEKSA